MLQKILLAMAFVACAAPVFAQHSPNPALAHLMPATRMALQQQFSRAHLQQKGTGGLAEMLVAYSAKDADGALLDSTRYVYSGSRTSQLTNNDPGSYTDSYSPDAELQPFAYGSYSTNYLQYDTAYNYAPNAAGGLAPGYLSYKLYNEANQPTLYYTKNYNSSSFGGAQQSRYTMAYNAGSAVSHVAYEEDTSAAATGAYVLQYATGMAYNGAGARTLDTNYYPQVPDTNYTVYSYNAVGLLDTVSHFLLTGGEALTDYRTAYRYDAGGRLLSARRQSWNGLGFEDTYLDTFGYTGNEVLYTYNASYDLFNEGSPAQYEFYGNLNAAGAYDTVLILYDDGSGMLAPAGRIRLSYNAANHLEYIYYDQWNGAAYDPQPYETDRYYYTPQSTGGIAAAPSATALTLYPNPAVHSISVGATGQATVSVYNTAGQLLLQQSGMAGGVMTISIAPLPAGTYVAESRTGQGLQRGTFVKQ